MLKLKGCFTALLTPFKAGRVDAEALKKMVRFQLERGGWRGDERTFFQQVVDM